MDVQLEGAGAGWLAGGQVDDSQRKMVASPAHKVRRGEILSF
jgi:hypothetical protein